MCNLLVQSFCAALLILPTMPNQAQTCNDAVISTAPDSRYQINGDGTVTDLQTSLMWQQCSHGQSGNDCATGDVATVTWDQALQLGDNLNNSGGYASYTDWRLPNSKELESLVEEACYSPAINIISFPTTPSLYYWSSSSSAVHPYHLWYVEFNFGHSIQSNWPNFRDGNNPVRLVRSGS